MDRPTPHEQLEACRPGRDDLHEPELAELRALVESDERLARRHAALQAVDAHLQTVWREVEPPAGLEHRLLERLRAASAEAATDAAAETPIDEAVVAPAPTAPLSEARPRRNRRVWLIAALTTAASLAAVGAWVNLQQPGVYMGADVPEAALHYHQHEASDAPLHGMQNLAPVALSRRIHPDLAQGWRKAEGFLGSRAGGVAYVLQAPNGGPAATLYAVRGQAAGLPSGPTPEAAVRTGGAWATAWHEDDLVFVLVIPHHQPGSHRYFLPPSGGIAAAGQPLHARIAANVGARPFG